MRRPVSMAAAAAVAFAALALGGCSDDDGAARDDPSAATPSPTPTAGERPSPPPSPSPTPTPTDVGVEDLAGGWMPAESDHGAVYTLLVDRNGDADSVGSPGPYSALGEDQVCFGSIEDEDEDESGGAGAGAGRFRVELECSSLADLGGPQDTYRGTATVEPAPASAGSMWDILGCDEAVGVLLVTWADGFQDALCRTSEAEATSGSGSA
ncbi:hypothetical protein ACTWP5_21010 [Streptomyces sp. 4N509B]|uniref:hypothetical protein n=1 Tax=Streptomyces sp. 4N509B TaxID=3457413 RepID=UPI003FD1C81B